MLRAGTQQSVFFPTPGMPGDQYGLTEDWLPSKGYLAASDITIATGVFGVNGTKTVQQSNEDGAVFAGFAVRGQDTVIPFASTSQGYGFSVTEGMQLQVLPRGNLMMVITTSFNEGSVINYQDAVYVNTTTGTLAVGVTDQEGYIQTDWVVTNIDLADSDIDDFVVISNLNQFLGQ